MSEAITIVVTTWAPDGPVGESRGLSTRKTILSWQQHLCYDGPLVLHIADDGSDHPDYQEVQAFLPWSVNDSPWSISLTRQERRGVGASLNAGLRAAFAHSPLALYAVDDWALTADLDLTPWAELLLESEDIGMVRLGPPHPWLAGEVLHTARGWVLTLERHHFAYAHRPALYHQRFFDAYGWFDEGLSALECERLYNERFCSTSGPGIALALPYPWVHVGEAEVGDVAP